MQYSQLYRFLIVHSWGISLLIIWVIEETSCTLIDIWYTIPPRFSITLTCATCFSIIFSPIPPYCPTNTIEYWIYYPHEGDLLLSLSGFEMWSPALGCWLLCAKATLPCPYSMIAFMNKLLCDKMRYDTVQAISLVNLYPHCLDANKIVWEYLEPVEFWSADQWLAASYIR